MRYPCQVQNVLHHLSLLVDSVKYQQLINLPNHQKHIEQAQQVNPVLVSVRQFVLLILSRDEDKQYYC